ncbi:hypothetical protein F5Y12DRAFT_782184 [Xylaria sp. FL1777]|nr:hypothetical protein F5Y12DRAFT_782184 [Xylaria sp. FL1777]
MNEDTARQLVRKGHDLEDVTRNQERLSRYFEQDAEKRFTMEGVIASGMFGLTWKLKYTASSNPAPQRSGPPPAKFRKISTSEPSVRHIVLKTDRVYSILYDDNAMGADGSDSDGKNEDGSEGNNEDNSEDNNEDSTIGSTTGSTEGSIEDNSEDNSEDNNEDNIEHESDDGNGYQSMNPNEKHMLGCSGTISKLISRVAEKQIRMPNRLLWRFFLCLVRMCIAMGWPPEKPDGENPQPVIEEVNGRPYGGLIHRDMHEGNVMIGDLIPDDPDLEHRLTPMLKLIDLGGMEKVEDDRKVNRWAVRENTFDIGLLMLELIGIDADEAHNIYPAPTRAKPLQVHEGGPEVLTNGIPLLKDDNNVTPFPWLDQGLRRVVCACLATEPENRPSPLALLNISTACVRDRDQQYYASRGREHLCESDEAIRAFLSEVVFDA